ncbi:hypothetical protein Tco_1379007 [Tanacetum coccineum]
MKFLRSLPSVWHVVATMIRGQPGLDELDFDDLYNNLKVYEHELKGVSNSNSQNIAFLSTEVKGSTLKTLYYEIICSFFSQQASMPTTHDDEDLLQIDEDAMENCHLWLVAYDYCKLKDLGHFARECRFAKYQENRANGRQEKKTVAIEDSNSKALVATDNNEDIDWTKEFDAEPVTYAMMALTEVEQDDWSMS